MPKISIFKFKLFFQKPKKLKFPIYPLKRYCSIFSFIRSCCTQKVCFIKVHSESSKFIRGGSYGPPKFFKKSIFSVFWGPLTFPLDVFGYSEGTFIRQTFCVHQDPKRKKLKNIVLGGKLKI